MIESKTEITSAAVALHYDELDNFYREIWGEHVHHGLWLTGRESAERAAVQLAELVAREAGIEKGSRVCDVGCGYGATARLFARDDGAEVTALTVSPAQHEFACAKEPGSGNPLYVLGDWLKNELPAESFDAVIAIESSEHMGDKPAFFAQAARVLRHGGRCVVTAWLARENASALENRLILEPVCREGRMASMGTASDYQGMFEAAGFRFGEFRDLTRQVKNTWPVCAWRFFIGLCRNPAYARFLFNRHKSNRIFALTMFRIWLAYNTGTMRYGIFTADKPA
ncbi:MAG TPA: methyltransferase domain-containing protein [Chthoniobacteraceae bacterium]|nr:methyltransferase domain-containing protein [Chthoniobacteraceae bacterium]